MAMKEVVRSWEHFRVDEVEGVLKDAVRMSENQKKKRWMRTHSLYLLANGWL